MTDKGAGMKPAVWRIFQGGRWSYSDQPSARHQDRPAWQPLYAHPEREWVGLTEDELNQIYAEPQTHAGQYARAIEAKLKEKNT